MEYIRNCIVCGREIIVHRKHPITPSQEKDVRKYCSVCWGNRLKGRPAHRWRPEDKYVDSQGYVHILVNGKHVSEHRYVMEQKLGRKLRKGEVVHHLDGNRANNSPENLSLYASSGKHSRDHCLGKPNLKNRGRIPSTVHCYH
jgi:hypothetical protein